MQICLDNSLAEREHDCGYVICDMIPEGNGCGNCVVCLEL